VHILMAMVRMEEALAAEDAPKRQIQRVKAWHLDIASTVLAAAECASPAGLILENLHEPRSRGTRGWAWTLPLAFVNGTRTHRAWLRLCEAILQALALQQVCAERARATAEAEADSAKSSTAKKQARARAAAAEAWRQAAAQAEVTGRVLVRAEDAILRPVGEAVAAVGGIREVALDKHYHQGR
jgi:chemotaxis protein histidine kinase CheA